MPARNSLPSFVEPQLATLVNEVPTGEEWIYEMKYDGYRTLIAANGNVVRCYSRRGLDWTSRFGAVPGAIANLNLRGALIDGEIVVMDRDGRTSFSGLQDALKAGGQGLTLCAFDLLFCDGKDLRDLPLSQRKAMLDDIFRHSPPMLLYSAHADHGGQLLKDSLCRRKFEGIIAKRLDEPYRSGRRGSWLKIKCTNEQEFVIAGFTRSDKKLPFASLVLALNEKDGLRYAGHVGTGFTRDERRRLRRLFQPLERATPPLAGKIPAAVTRRATWIEPRLLAQVAFTEFTTDGLARHPSYKGIREDKPPAAVRRERAKPLAEVRARPKRVSP